MSFRRSTLVYAVAFIAIMLASSFIPTQNAYASITVTMDTTKTIGTNSLSLGFQLDGDDVSQWCASSTLQQLSKDAGMKLVRFFEQRLGRPCLSWNEATKTGKWDWTTVDSRIKKVIAIGAEPLIVLGFIAYDTRRLSTLPSGMSYDRTTGLPKPEQWAAYCAAWVNHFKSVGLSVRYYEMINEAYHYFGWPATQPKLGYFMKLYNAAYKSMKAANSAVKIGNDACILKSVLNYFISNGERLDFLSYHAYGAETKSASDSQIFTNAETKYITETTNVYGVDRALAVYKAAKGVTLPVMRTENNLDFYFTTGTDSRIQKIQGAVYNALCIRTAMLKSFVFVSYFHFASSATDNPQGGLGFGMVNLDNNKPWYPYYAHKMIGSNLAKGDKLIQSTSSSSNVRVVAWIHGSKLNILLICKVNTAQSVILKGVSGTLQYQKLDSTISYWSSKIQTGSIASTGTLYLSGYTVMLLQKSI